VKDEMARLTAVRDVCRTVAGRYKGAVDEAEKRLEEMRRKGDPSVDELVCATTIVHNQWVISSIIKSSSANDLVDRLIDLVAEDNAIEDTMYHLHRALSAGRLDLDRFLRVRVPNWWRFVYPQTLTHSHNRRHAVSQKSNSRSAR
jgi:ESCRT-I complex subunit TSG101